MIETGDIQVIIEDGTNANLCQQIAYIKAGKTEIEEAVQEGIGDFNTNAAEKTNTFNSNASAKTLAFNQNADAKTLIYDNNASEKLAAYNENATNKFADFNTNATNKTTAFDLNATNKTTAFNNNASEKTSTFNDNAIAKTSGFNSNATSKTNDFNDNASDKTSAFNDNYLDKKALIDAEVQVAKDWATKTDGTVDGVDYSAKYYAQSLIPIKDDITAVAGIATDVSDVADIKDEVTAVANDKANIDTVADNISNVNKVASIDSDVSQVASIKNDVSTVSQYNVQVRRVAAIREEVVDVASVVSDIPTVASNVASISAVGSDISNVNTVASDSTAINSCANNMTAINNAPTYANNSKIWAEGLDGEVAPLGGTHSSKGWAQIAEAAASGVQNPANRDLSNLTNTGQMVIDSANGTISNCILEIPQNLKISMSNNVITLASGSIITRTGSVYETITTTADKTLDCSGFGNGTYYFIYRTNNNTVQNLGVSNVTSGSSLPETGTLNQVFFNVTDKSFYYYSSNGWTAWAAAYPLCIFNVNNGTATIIKDSNGNDMIFNGAGFIGHHAFVYPNVKGLAPNGFNEDDNLKSNIYNSTRLSIVEMNSANNGFDIASNTAVYRHKFGEDYQSIEELENDGVYHYIKNENIYAVMRSNELTRGSVTLFVKYTYDGTTVTDFTICQPYEGARNLLTDDVLNGDNTFTGKNTFLQNPVVEGTNQFYEIKDDNLTKGTAPTSTDRDSFIQVVDVSEQPLAACFYRVDTSGNAYTALVSYKFENASNDNAQIGIWYRADGTSYATCPTPIEDTNNSTQIDTVGARNTKLASLFTSITGYDSTQTQTLKNINGVLTWVTD